MPQTARTTGRLRPRGSSERAPLARAIGRHIRALRVAAGMTQAQLAQPTYTPGLLANIETGRSLPSLDALEYLARRLHRSPRALIPPRA
jgi:transcriptional regulator with XRE-family HTH domain